MEKSLCQKRKRPIEENIMLKNGTIKDEMVHANSNLEKIHVPAKST